MGGGVSGIAAAHYLRRGGRHPEILERDGRLGGRIGVASFGGRPIELGGKNVGRRYALFRSFAAEHGDPAWEHVGVNTARVDGGRLRTIDSSRRIRSFLAQLGQRSPSDLVRFACLALRVRWDERNGFVGGPGFRALADDPVVSERFGAAFCRDAWRPMSLLMNAAEPDEVHVGTLGTNVRMALDDYDQLADGMAPLLDRFAATVPTRLRTSVRAIRVEDGAVVGLELDEGTLDCDGVVLALPAPAAADLVAPHLPEVADELRAVRYFPTAVVVAGYARDVFRPDVRALRFEEDEVLGSARAYGKEALDVVRYTFSGRAARPFLRGPLDGEALLERGEEALGRHLPLSGRQRWVAPERAMALCAYSAHHAERVDRIVAGSAGIRGLHLTGDWRRGASIEACFRGARECVDRIEEERGC